MSSLYSDPPFPRGTTYLAGETIESDAIGPVAGRDFVGQVKVFQDCNPTTGLEHSNRLVTCVAARWTGSTGGIVAGDVVAFDFSTNGLTNVAAKGSTTVGVTFGVVDEYIPSTTEIRQNDIVWVAVRGPAGAKFTSTAVASAGTAVYIANTGLLSATASGNVLGHNLAAVGASSSTPQRVNLIGPTIGV